MTTKYAPGSDSDCECLIPLYLEHGTGFAEHLDGQYAVVLHDARDDSWVALRDPIGIAPLYRGWGEDGSTM